MNSKEYLSIRRRQDILLAGINDDTQVDDPKIIEVLSLQDECDRFERENFHKDGYDEINLEIDIRILVKVIRMAHNVGMNASDFVNMLICEHLDDIREFVWTTDIRNIEHCSDANAMPVAIPETVLEKLGWTLGDFIRITARDGSIVLNKIDME